MNKLSKNEKSKYKRRIFLLHGIEFVIFLIILSFYNKIFLFVLYGILIHLFLDFVDLIQKKEPLYSKISQIYVYISNKKKKNPKD